MGVVGGVFLRWFDRFCALSGDVQGNLDREKRPASGAISGCDFAIVGFDKLASNGKSQAGRVHLHSRIRGRTIKTFEEMWQGFFRDSIAAIGDFDHGQIFFIVSEKRNFNLAFLGRMPDRV